MSLLNANIHRLSSCSLVDPTWSTKREKISFLINVGLTLSPLCRLGWQRWEDGPVKWHWRENKLSKQRQFKSSGIVCQRPLPIDISWCYVDSGSIDCFFRNAFVIQNCPIWASAQVQSVELEAKAFQISLLASAHHDSKIASHLSSSNAYNCFDLIINMHPRNKALSRVAQRYVDHLNMFRKSRDGNC